MQWQIFRGGDSDLDLAGLVGVARFRTQWEVFGGGGIDLGLRRAGFDGLAGQDAVRDKTR